MSSTDLGTTGCETKRTWIVCEFDNLVSQVRTGAVTNISDHWLLRQLTSLNSVPVLLIWDQIAS
jgi:hypothetical protein